jgi:hypothetical protein
LVAVLLVVDVDDEVDDVPSDEADWLLSLCDASGGGPAW